MANPISEHGLGQMKSLKPTRGKTPVPKRTVLPPAPKKRVSLNPMQQAQLNVRRMLAPQYSALDAENARQNQAIQAYTTAVMQQLAGQAPQIAAIYDPQIQQQAAMSQAAADSLRAVNPSGDVAKLLDAVGAPQAQTQQIQGNLNNVFNGGAAVGNYLAGVSPAEVLRSQETAAQSLAALQPGFAALAGRQTLASALKDQADARAKIASQVPSMIQDQLNTFTSNSMKRQQLRDNQIALGIKTNQAQQRINNQQAQFIARTKRQIAEFNAKQTLAQNKLANPNPSLSAKVGYVVDSSGKPILLNGKRQILPGFNTNKQGRVVKNRATKAAAKAQKADATFFPNLTKTQVQHLRSGVANVFYGFTDKKGVKHPPLGYEEAITEAVKSGFSRAAATRMANRFYQPGQRGRPAKGNDSSGLGLVVPPLAR